GYLCAVRSSLRLAHHGPDDRAGCLRLAGPHLLDRLRVVRYRSLDQRLQLAAVRDRGETLRLDDRRRLAPRAGELGKDVFRGRLRKRLALDHHDEIRERLWRELRVTGILETPFAKPRHQLARNPP